MVPAVRQIQDWSNRPALPCQSLRDLPSPATNLNKAKVEKGLLRDRLRQKDRDRPIKIIICLPNLTKKSPTTIIRMDKASPFVGTQTKSSLHGWRNLIQDIDDKYLT
jgi:hypothetical protein